MTSRTTERAAKRSLTILDAVSDSNLLGRWFKGPSWTAWRVFLAALFALPMNEADRLIYTRHTGRQAPPAMPAREAWAIVGRRGGKSRIAGLIAVFLATFRDYRPLLAPGEVGTVMLLASDRRQARVLLRYITGFFEAVPMLKAMVVNQTRDTIELSNKVVIEIHTSNRAAVRGYSLIAAICDEIAFWPTADDAANPDTEILAALRPAMATIPGAMLIAISSPYARRGCLWDAYLHHGKDGDATLVWQADTASMNPEVDPQVIADAYEADSAAAAAEYGAEFRRDIEGFVSREAVDSCVVPGRLELPPVSGTQYFAFVDPSGGGGGDSFTLAIAHREGDRIVLDAIRERRPPFSPDDVIKDDFAPLIRSYGCHAVTGDRWGGQFPVDSFRRVPGGSIEYRLAEHPKSDLYRELLPLLSSKRLELLDQKRLLTQICALERRAARGGRDQIDHPPKGHDDLVNVVAGVSHLANKRRVPFICGSFGGEWSICDEDGTVKEQQARDDFSGPWRPVSGSGSGLGRFR